MNRVGALGLVVLPIAQAQTTELEARSSWDDFKKKWNRQYKHHDEEAYRFVIFQERLKWINEENGKGHASTMVVNEFTDLSISEFKSTHANLVQPKAGGGLFGAAMLGYHVIEANESFAGDVDWVSRGAVTPVKNQGQCGSCWSFSTTGAIEGRWQIATGNLMSLSESLFVDCDSSNYGCSGGWPYVAITWAESQYLCTESSYPYQAVQGSCRASGCTVVSGARISGYRQTSEGSASSMMSALNAGPVSVCVDAEGAFMQYGGGILTNYCGTTLDHAVLAVGYTGSYWKVKNSWGTSWGEAGYIRLDINGNKCGVLNAGAYPVVVPAASREIVV